MGNTLRLVGGITLLERLLRQLSELGAVDRISLLKPRDSSLPKPSKRVRKAVTYHDAAGSDAWAMMRDARPYLADRFIAVAADLLIDQRLLAWLAEQSIDTILSPKAGEAPEVAAVLHARSLDATSFDAARIEVAAVSAMPTYWDAMHGEVPFHLRRIATEADAEACWPILLDYIQRRTLELPAQYFDPYFESLLVRWLAPTAITANQVTLITTALGFVVSLLYYSGWLRFGVLLAVFVEVLDGVDGKLARITRTTSKAGEYEHVLDFFYENSWYIALGFYLPRSGFEFAWTAAVLMVAFDLIDNIVYSVADVRWGRSVDNATHFLARFRLIAGRRNIYNWLFLPWILIGLPAYGFYMAVAWAGITAAIHAWWCVGEAVERTGTGITS
ncbi:MAG: CDP-alcohol phosphatidyltransferase family protein [Candidatus Binatus sp.]|uniref:CDP-alcohol phosphatidyltransferase family protein n=1 Tax=Candidatus Binatus sp. TaxID=2811406 RepID=UPI0027160CBE|nr:CDP-alcohol phosphatidyltransferase family protein [Candidatus Binatus sp.]MDO8432608.1 CDP-alcohol phosphatidyltransferase family protein [Candidatus Binatus sp.]